MLRERPTQIKVDSRRDEGGRLRTNTWVWSILLLTSFACTEVIINEENISGDLDVNPCLFELSIEELAGRPCLTDVIESLRDAPADQQVGCVHLRWTDIMRQSPIAVSDAYEERGRTVIFTERINLNLGEGVEVGRDFIFQWLFIDNATPETCAALPVDATCANVPGCFFAVGPATILPDSWTVTGQNAAGVCQYSTPDGVGLVHPEVCDERDNNCDGVVDNAPECVDEPIEPIEPGDPPVLEAPCVDSRDCNPNQPLCIEGLCRACWPELLECQSVRQPFCTPEGICRGCQNDAECSNGSFCDLGTGACIECRGNADCPALRPFCRADGLCDGCNPALGDLCPDGQSCLADGTCGQCANNDGCPISAPYCNDETNLCEGCVSESDCQDGYRCFENLCRECTQPGVDILCESPNAPICDAETYTCRACVSDDECGEYSYCYQGACRGCSPDTNAGCEGTGRICNPDGFSCGECTLDDQCAQYFPDAPYCNLEAGACGACEPGTNRGCIDGSPICVALQNGAICQPCVNDASCAGMAGAVCDEGRCVACADDNDCNGQVCATVSGSRTCAECNPEAEVGNNGCPAERPQCGETGVCVECDENAQCPSAAPICEANVCRACTADVECAYAGRVCAAGRCSLCDGSRTSPDDPNIDFACTPEFPNCTIGNVRCTR
ncbi:MAG: hypothetical protein ACON3Z_04655 [Bradymonadia bacterium]